MRLQKHCIVSSKFSRVSKNFKVSGNFWESPETFQGVCKLSKVPRNFPRVSINFAECPETLFLNATFDPTQIFLDFKNFPSSNAWMLGRFSETSTLLGRHPTSETLEHFTTCHKYLVTQSEHTNNCTILFPQSTPECAACTSVTVSSEKLQG